MTPEVLFLAPEQEEQLPEGNITNNNNEIEIQELPEQTQNVSRNTDVNLRRSTRNRKANLKCGNPVPIMTITDSIIDSDELTLSRLQDRPRTE